MQEIIIILSFKHYVLLKYNELEIIKNTIVIPVKVSVAQLMILSFRVPSTREEISL